MSTWKMAFKTEREGGTYFLLLASLAIHILCIVSLYDIVP